MKRSKFSSVCFPKHVVLLLVLFSLCTACKQGSNEGLRNETNGNEDLMEGVWELTNQFWVSQGDTLFLGPDEIPVKHKIYLDGYVIWTAAPSYDSLAWHAYGTYSLSGGTLVETFESMSLPVEAESGSQGEVVYQVEVEQDYCKQSTNRLHPRRGSVYLVVEEWKRLNSGADQ